MEKKKRKKIFFYFQIYLFRIDRKSIKKEGYEDYRPTVFFFKHNTLRFIKFRLEALVLDICLKYGLYYSFNSVK